VIAHICDMREFKDISTSDPRLKRIIEKIEAAERLNREDGLVLERTNDLHTVCQLADTAKEHLYGNRASYIVNTHIDYTNICKSMCTFCAYSRTPDSDDAYVLTPEEAVDRVDENSDEIHVIGGINPSLPFQYFHDLVSTLKHHFPKATIKAFTAVELHDLALREKRDIGSILKELKDAGLEMLPGGGAEIFDPEIRSRICPDKATGDEWLEVHRTAHGLGISTNSTMLHGHIEKPSHRIDHLLSLRNLQDETGGFIAHIPLPYLQGNNELSELAMPQNGLLDLRQIAIARLILDNIPHIKAYWRVLGIRMAQAGLMSGADDIDGTIGREDVMHDAGSSAPRSMSPKRLAQIIENTSLNAYRRDALHRSKKEVTI